VPKIEVTFDIDANGILNVAARDQATSKEQKITITGSSGLSDTEVDRMVREAEEHADEDRKRREAISLRNDAESMVFQAEKTLSEYGDKVSVEIKTELDEKIQAVKQILETDRENVDRLKPAYEEMVQTLSKVGSAMYGQAGEASPNGDADFAGAEPEETVEDDSTVEGEFREVGSER
jgi:molecular chaperone DnaK